MRTTDLGLDIWRNLLWTENQEFNPLKPFFAIKTQFLQPTMYNYEFLEVWAITFYVPFLPSCHVTVIYLVPICSSRNVWVLHMKPWENSDQLSLLEMKRSMKNKFIFLRIFFSKRIISAFQCHMRTFEYRYFLLRFLMQKKQKMRFFKIHPFKNMELLCSF